MGLMPAVPEPVHQLASAISEYPGHTPGFSFATLECPPRVDGSIPSPATIFKFMNRMRFRVSAADYPPAQPGVHHARLSGAGRSAPHTRRARRRRRRRDRPPTGNGVLLGGRRRHDEQGQSRQGQRGPTTPHASYYKVLHGRFSPMRPTRPSSTASSSFDLRRST